MKILTYKKIKHPKRKREYLPLAYSIRKSNAAKLFTIESAMSAMMGAAQLATIQSQVTDLRNGAAKMNKALLIVESIKNTGEAIMAASKKLQRVY